MPHEFENGRRVARFRSKGAAHYIQTGFLLFWLCGWAVGELFAAGSLLAIGLAYLPREWVLIPGLPSRPEPAFTLAAGAFLVVWLTLWTLGGVMAMRDLLRILGSCDEIQWELRSRREIPAGQILRFREELPRPGLVVDLPRGSVELTRRGTRMERRALELALRSALPGRRAEASPTGLPAAWAATTDASGNHVLSMARQSLSAGLGLDP
jgi:hypothetical protein